jgi:hypothetical protein
MEIENNKDDVNFLKSLIYRNWKLYTHI